MYPTIASQFPQSLIERIQAGRIVPFVGAGVSMAIKSKIDGTPLFPSWKQLLLRAAERLESENKRTYGDLVKNLIEIDKPEYLQAAKFARDALGPIWFEFLKEQFDHTKDQADDSTLELARSIWRLGSNLIITTNYDRSLRWANPNHEDLNTWSIEAPAEQANMLKEGLQRSVIWHLHGCIDDAANLILTPDSYDRIYSSNTVEARYSTGLQTLNFVIQSRSLLFIGFSLDDIRFGQNLKSASEVFAGASGPHYALVHASNKSAFENLDIPGVELIPFADYGAPIIQIINDLHSYKATESLSINIESPPNEIEVEGIQISYVTDQGILEEFDDSCDTPPPTATWVGRSTEMELLSSSSIKVIAITGIGGQGKSTLIAKFLTELPEVYTTWDWRDCKEESNTLHTHLVRIIERLTKGRQKASSLSSESIENVVRIFYNLTASMRAVFVFDNIDKYIDANRAQAVGGMHALISGALKSPGGSKFVFTSRPKIDYPDTAFLQIELNGLSLIETISLFESRSLEVDLKSIEEVHELTQGHPLWISLIITQVLKNRVEIKQLITKIKGGKEAGLPNAMLQEIWKTLTPKQQKLLRYLAELVRPESEKQLEKYVERDLNSNQFHKLIRQLKHLDLVVVKSPQNAIDTIELHPLVREFVRRQYSQSERMPYIGAIIAFLNDTIAILRPNLRSEMSYAILQNWTTKVDLLTNSGNYIDAILVLEEARVPLQVKGYSEEFIRLAIGVLSIVDWADLALADSKGFEDIFKSLVDELDQMGRFSESDEFINRFESIVAGATSKYVLLCEMRCHHYWCMGDFELAKEWGRRGVELKKNSSIDTRHDCGHDLALAQRDSGEIDPAVEYFLHGTSLEDSISTVDFDKSRAGAFYGNIGRSLHFKGDTDNALTCLVKAAWLIERESNAQKHVNVGWASMWLGEILEEKELYDDAYACYRRASIKWEFVSPFRAERAQAAAKKIESMISSSSVKINDLNLDIYFSKLLSKYLKAN